MLSEEQIADLKAKHGARLEMISDESGDLEVVVKPPPEAEWDRFTTMLLDDEQKPRAMKTLVRSCVVYPEAAELKRLIAEQPGIVSTIGGQLSEMAGASRAVSRKKL